MTAVAATVAYPQDGIGGEATVVVEVKRHLEEVAEGTVLPGSLSRPRSFTCATLATLSYRWGVLCFQISPVRSTWIQYNGYFSFPIAPSDLTAFIFWRPYHSEGMFEGSYSRARSLWSVKHDDPTPRFDHIGPVLIRLNTLLTHDK